LYNPSDGKIKADGGFILWRNRKKKAWQELVDGDGYRNSLRPTILMTPMI